MAVPVGVDVDAIPATNRTVGAASTNNVVLTLRLTSDSGDVELRRLRLRAAGLGDDRSIRLVQLYVDDNANGRVDAGEPSVASGTFGTDDGLLDLTMNAPLAIGAGRNDLLVTYDF